MAASPGRRGAGRVEAAPGASGADPRDAQIARLRKEKAQLEKELATARFVVDVQSKMQALLEKLSEGADSENEPSS
jgi:hypothetical protein